MRENSNTAKVWVDAFVIPMLTVLIYIRAEKEGEWALHLYAVKQMLPYFSLLDTITMQGMQQII